MILRARAETGTSSNSSNSIALILLVLALGASIYLYRTGYIRGKPGLFTMVILAVSLFAMAVWMYQSG